MLQLAIPILASLSAEETIKFYTEKLGFTLQSNWDGYLILSRDQIFIHLWHVKTRRYPRQPAATLT
jgi:catechol 2,3-dioxygenase-like lactoylglutathione lyase family enzyme